MSTCFWYKDCPNCGDYGRLFIVEDLSHRRLYLHCEECEFGWDDPLTLRNGFLTLTLDYSCALADRQTIEKYKWQAFALHEVEAAHAPPIC
ncbi:MAG TPA: hypothetical protein VFR78_00900 [Pyrinomonadaceae bacterium]|nr:hypothetical protein [Pyrinomonadaceae bacterium]